VALSGHQSLPPREIGWEIDGTLTQSGVASPFHSGRGLGAMGYIAFVLGRALTVTMVVGLSLLLLVSAVVYVTAIFVLSS
jgi:hypothetical protein